MGGWEHECCGSGIERHQRVHWTDIIHTDGRLYETHHDLEGMHTAEVAGAVVDLELVRVDGSRVAVARIPSGEALLGSDDGDDRVVTSLHTGEVLDASTHEFVVTVEPVR